MDEYLAAPLVADPLSRYDCVPVIAGAQAIIVARPDRAPKGRPGVRVRAHRASYNYDNQQGDGLQTGISTFADELWREAGVRPGRHRRRQRSTTTIRPWCWRRPTISASFRATIWRASAASTIGEKRFPVNTWGGMLSAGQPGGHAGGLNGISEAVLQLQHRAGERQVKGARLAVDDRLRHDDVPLRRHGGGRDPGARRMSAGVTDLALRELPRRDFSRSRCCVRAVTAARSKPTASMKPWSRKSPSSAT